MNHHRKTIPCASAAIGLAAALGTALLVPFARTRAGDVVVAQFVRSDVNDDGRRDISDAVRILDWLFLGANDPPCADAADANDDGRVDISDASWILGYLFLGAIAPPAPFEACGLDPTADALDCREFRSCPPVDPRVDFTRFVLDLIDATSDTTDPVEINGIEFRFDDDPHAFDSLFDV